MNPNHLLKPLGIRSRRGFSLVEILVVVAIIGVLIALLIPAIQSVRNSAKRTQNQNNIRQILLACLNYASQSNGNLPSGSTFPGVGGDCEQDSQWYPYNVYFACQSTYTNNGGGTVETDKVCYNSLTLSEVITKDTKGKLLSDVINEDPTTARTDWVDGSPFFQILPLLGYDGTYHSSYGPMAEGIKSKYWDDGKSGCKCAAGWTCDYYCTCNAPLVCPPPVGWVHTDNSKTSPTNKGYQAGKVPSYVKPYMGVDDPTLGSPGMLAPLSYPMFGNVSGNIEQFNTSYTAFVTEAYSGCPGSAIAAFAPNTGYGNNENTYGSYNSWAFSKFIDRDMDPQPLAPFYNTVSWGSGLSEGRKFLYMGVVTDPSPYQYNFAPSPCDGLGMQEQWVDANVISKVAGAQSEDLYPWQQALPGCAGLKRWYILSPSGKKIYGNGLYYADPQFSWCDPSNPLDLPGCHPKDWYYDFMYPIQNSNFFQDHPLVNTGCSFGNPQTMVPGSLCVGMLDGSIRNISPSIERSAIEALINGQAPTTDVGSW